MNSIVHPGSHGASDSPALLGPAGWMLLALLGFAAQALLWTNPGYFSHDELQWAAAADVAHWQALPWVDWFDLSPLQYRPLTFNAWLLLSYALFDRPMLFHALFVAVGTANGVLLALLLRRWFDHRAAIAGFTLLLFNPYVALVHGWVATLGDLLWTAAGLLIALVVTSRRAKLETTLLAGFLFTAAALLAKEAALSIPLLLVLAAVLDRSRRGWRLAAAGALTAAGLYLSLRLGVITHQADSTSYAVQPLQAPLRWLEYQLFPFVLQRLEPGTVKPGSLSMLLVAPLLLASTAIALWRTSQRHLLAWLLGGALALAPTLPLGASYSQYAYGFSLLWSGCIGHAWARGDRTVRGLLILPVVVMALHAVNVQRQMHSAGTMQQRFHADVVTALQNGASTVVVWPTATPYHVARWTHAIPAWHGTPLGDRVRLAESPDEATHVMQPDGRLRPVGNIRQR